jgi:hypothetical protein
MLERVRIQIQSPMVYIFRLFFINIFFPKTYYKRVKIDLIIKKTCFFFLSFQNLKLKEIPVNI